MIEQRHADRLQPLSKAGLTLRCQKCGVFGGRDILYRACDAGRAIR